MPNIDDLPTGITDAGADHNYTGPALATVVLVNAPVDRDHHNAAASRAPYDTYIAAETTAGRAHTATNVQMRDPRRPFKLDIDYDDAHAYNYARITIGTRRWYLFIDTIDYSTPNTTAFHCTIDPFPTYNGWSLRNSHIERGHAAVAASQTDTYGDQYCLAPEPIAAPPSLGVLAADILDSDADDWTIILISANDLRGHGTATPYFEKHSEETSILNAHNYAWLAGQGPIVGAEVYQPTGGGDHGYDPADYQANYPWQGIGPGADGIYVPSVKPSQPSTIDGVTQGGGAYKFTLRGYLRWLSIMQGASWIMEGITDYRIVPSWAVSGGGDSSSAPATQPPETATHGAWASAAAIPVYDAAISTGTYDTTVLSGWRSTYLNSVGAQYYRKLVTGAFTNIVIGEGDTTTTYEPELMRTTGVNVHARTGAAHGENSIRLTADYNELTDQKAVTMAAGGTPGSLASGFGRAAANTGAADLGLANSAYNSYLTRNTMGYNHALAIELEETKIPMNLGIVGVQSVMQGAGGAALAGFAGAGPLGAAAGAVVGGGTALVTGALSSNSSLDMLDISHQGTIDIGSYQLAVNGVFNTMSFRTWVQALRAVSGKGAAGGLASAWRIATGRGFQAVVVAPRPDQVRQLLSTWRRYGYMIGRAFTPPQLNAMSHYTYWKTNEATITGPIPQDDRARIAAAFDRGVTLYNDLADIERDVAETNAPLTGYTY